MVKCGIRKCRVCIVEDMLNPNWCKQKCEIRNDIKQIKKYNLLKKDDLKVKAENINKVFDDLINR